MTYTQKDIKRINVRHTSWILLQKPTLLVMFHYLLCPLVPLSPSCLNLDIETAIIALNQLLLTSRVTQGWSSFSASGPHFLRRHRYGIELLLRVTRGRSDRMGGRFSRSRTSPRSAGTESSRPEEDDEEPHGCAVEQRPAVPPCGPSAVSPPSDPTRKLIAILRSYSVYFSPYLHRVSPILVSNLKSFFVSELILVTLIHSVSTEFHLLLRKTVCVRREMHSHQIWPATS